MTDRLIVYLLRRNYEFGSICHLLEKCIVCSRSFILSFFYLKKLNFYFRFCGNCLPTTEGIDVNQNWLLLKFEWSIYILWFFVFNSYAFHGIISHHVCEKDQKNYTFYCWMCHLLIAESTTSHTFKSFVCSNLQTSF